MPLCADTPLDLHWLRELLDAAKRSLLASGHHQSRRDYGNFDSFVLRDGDLVEDMDSGNRHWFRVVDGDTLNVRLALRFIEVSEESETTCLRGLVDRWVVSYSNGRVDAVPRDEYSVMYCYEAAHPRGQSKVSCTFTSGSLLRATKVPSRKTLESPARSVYSEEFLTSAYQVMINEEGEYSSMVNLPSSAFEDPSWVPRPIPRQHLSRALRS